MLLSIVLFMSAFSAIGAVDNFSLSLNFIEVGSPINHEYVELGMDVDATAGFDAAFDLFLPPPMGVGYHFVHDEPYPFDRLISDYRNTSDIGAIWRVGKHATSFGVNVVFGDTSAIFSEDSYAIYFKIIGVLDPEPERPFIDSTWQQLATMDTVNYNPTLEVLLFSVDIYIPVGIDETKASPGKIEIHAPRPNPFNACVKIPIFIKDCRVVSVQIVDLLGKRIRSIPNIYGPGEFEIIWDGRDDSGISMPGGIYLCRINSEDVISYEKVLLVK